jgi:poly-gamma-glutamate synthesis protein (capsule biosynthesis protein)
MAYPFDSTRAVLLRADITVANLEAPFTSQGQPFEKTYTFRVPPQYAGSLKDAGLDVLTLANNHVFDYGPSGFFTTADVLDSLGLVFCGAGRDRTEAERGVIVERDGWRAGFLAYSLTYPSEFWAGTSRPGTAFPVEDRVRARIQALGDSADFVVVSFHWGGERMDHPKPYQRRWARFAVDAGADLVIGHHPHVLQGVEFYKGGLIAYSLGNYVFGSYNRKSPDSAILKVRFDRKGLLIAEIIPILVNNYEVHFQPRRLRGEERKRVLRHVNAISRPLNGGRDVVGESGLVVLE